MGIRIRKNIDCSSKLITIERTHRRTHAHARTQDFHLFEDHKSRNNNNSDDDDEI